MTIDERQETEANPTEEELDVEGPNEGAPGENPEEGEGGEGESAE
jgi:hypothetical protein